MQGAATCAAVGRAASDESAIQHRGNSSRLNEYGPAGVGRRVVAEDARVDHRVVVHAADQTNGAAADHCGVGVEHASNDQRAAVLDLHAAAVARGAVGDGHAVDNGVGPFAVDDLDNGHAQAGPVDHGGRDDVRVQRVCAAEGDRLAKELDGLVVAARRDDDLIAVHRGVDAGLDGRLIAGDVDDVGLRGREHRQQHDAGADRVYWSHETLLNCAGVRRLNHIDQECTRNRSLEFRRIGPSGFPRQSSC